MQVLIENTRSDLLETYNDKVGNDYFISGPMLEYDRKNRNGRTYPKDTMLNEVNRFNSEFVMRRRSVGELNHPSVSTPTIDYFRVSHYITELSDRGNGIVFGKAKILDTGPGKIVKTLMDEDIQLGVSSRATGSLKKKGDSQVVQEDFRLSTIDIVADPSAHSAFVDNIRENFDNFLEEGIIQEGDTNYLMEHIEQYNKEIEKRMQEARIQELFEDLITGFKKSKLRL